MITNLEWLYENDREGLIDMAASDDCDVCLVDECDGENSMTYEMCAETRKEWFKSEYVEQEQQLSLGISNGDYIRSMSNEELAEFLMSSWFTDNVCKNCESEYNGYDKCGDMDFCESKIFEWLSKNKR